MGYADIAEEAKRRTVLTRKPEVVLIKLLDFPEIGGGLTMHEKDVAKRQEETIQEAEKHGFDPAAYGRVDAGLQVMNNAPQVFIDLLIDMGLFGRKSGLKLVGCYRERYKKSGRWQIDLVLNYSTEGEEIEMPEAVLEVVKSYRSAHGTIFANWKYRNPENPKAGQFRLDTINLKGTRPVKNNNGYQLVTQGNTYRLQNAITGETVSVEDALAAVAAKK